MKKAITLCLVLMLLLSTLLLGCTSPAEVATEAPAAENAEVVESTDANSNEPIKLSMFIGTHNTIPDVNLNETIKHIEEKFNVDLELTVAPYDATAAREKFALTMASGDYPDIICSQYIYATDEVTLGQKEGIFIGLNDYIDNRSTYLKAYFDANPTARKIITNVDGEIYSLPVITENPSNMFMNKMWVNDTFVQKLGIEYPRTTEDFYKMLVAFKESDPNGNGIADEISLAAARGGWGSDLPSFLMNSFCNYQMELDIDADYNTFIGMYLDNGTVKSVVGEDGYRMGLQYLNKLYSEGLIYEGSLTQDMSTQLKQLVENPDTIILGAVPGIHPGAWSNWGDRYSIYRSIPVLDSGVAEPLARSYYYSQSVKPGHSAITDKCEYPELAFDILDYCYSEEMFHRNWHGVPEVDWKYCDPADNLVGLDGQPAIWQYTNGWVGGLPEQNQACLGILPSAQLAEYINGEAQTPGVDINTGAGFMQLMYNTTINDMEPYANFDAEMPPVRFTEEETEAMQASLIEYANFIRNQAVKFIVGIDDINDDAVWTNYLEELSKIGQDTIVASYQTAYDRQYK